MTRVLTIGIAGAGIAGLTAALFLHRAGHRVHLFDQYDTPQPVGSGLVVQPVGRAVLAELELENAALELGSRIHRMIGTDARSGRTVLDADYDAAGGGRFGLAMHRASLFSVLHEAVIAEGIPLHGDATVAGVTSTPPRWIIFDDGRKEGPFDLVINASGANTALAPHSARLAYGALWGSVPWPDGTSLDRSELQQRYRGARTMLGVLPIGHLPGDTTPRAAVFWSLPQSAYDGWQNTPIADWKADAKDLWPDFHRCLETIKTHDDLTMARYRHGRLRKTTAPGLVHIGDAAHAASPQLGQGANMALLDAAALASALSIDDQSAALEAYRRSRHRHVLTYQWLSWVFTPMYQSNSQILPLLRDWVLMPASRIPPAPWVLSRLVCGDLVAPIIKKAPA